MKYAKHGCENTQTTPYGDYAEQLSDNGFTPLPADGKAVRLRDWPHFVIPSDSSLPSSISLGNCRHISSSLEHNWSKCIPVARKRE